MKKISKTIFLVVLYFIGSIAAMATNSAIDKVYHPYILPNETEVEWRLLSQRNDNVNTLVQRFGYGFSLSDHVMIEGYVVGKRDSSDDYSLQAYEIEMRWMLTEQGQYWADFGALFTLEKQYNMDDWSAKSGLLFEKEFGRTSLAMNFFVEQEWGSDAKAETETDFRFQYRYRWIPQLQPAIEFYSGNDYVGIGPAFMGLQRFDIESQLKWEVGFIFGLKGGLSNALTGKNKNQALRIDIEYEF